ncbi:hypothetical protein [Phenylobacterium sp.]|uniref:hypothetical protein n=1 Tax=Phenylobacterium sp. TaxID=1871053 RepID=UPI0035B47EA7
MIAALMSVLMFLSAMTGGALSVERASATPGAGAYLTDDTGPEPHQDCDMPNDFNYFCVP